MDKNTQDIMNGLQMLFAANTTPTSVEMKGYADSLGRYPATEVMAAAREFSNNRHQYKQAANRWPYVGEIEDTLRRWHTKATVFPANALPSPSGSLQEAAGQYGQWFREWIIAIHPSLISPTDSGWGYRMMMRRLKWTDMVNEFWKANKNLQEAFVDAPFYKRATLYWQRTGKSDFENWITAKDSAEEDAWTEKMLKITKKGNIGNALNR